MGNCPSSGSGGRIAETQNLWSEHTSWTREVLLAVKNYNTSQVQRLGANLANQANQAEEMLKSSVDRLLLNQVHLGNDLAEFTNKDVGKRYTELLTTHIVITKNIMDDVFAGKNVSDSIELWKQNGMEIADFLSSLNPCLDKDGLSAYFMQHLDSLSAQILHVKNNRWPESIQEFDRGRKMVMDDVEKVMSACFRKLPGGFKDCGCGASKNFHSYPGYNWEMRDEQRNAERTYERRDWEREAAERRAAIRAAIRRAQQN